MSVRERLRSIATGEKSQRFRLVTAASRWTYLGFAALTAFMAAGTILSDVLLDDDPSHTKHRMAALHVSLEITAVSTIFFVLSLCGWLSKWFPVAITEDEAVDDGTVWPPPPKAGK